MAEWIPDTGHVVHYVAYGTPGGEYQAGAHRAAVITEVVNTPDGLYAVGLCIMNPTGLYFVRDAQIDPTGETPGTWHWPESGPAMKAT